MTRAARVLIVGIVMLTFGAMPIAVNCCAARCAAVAGCHRAMGAIPCTHCRDVVAAMDPTLSQRDPAACSRTVFALPPALPAPHGHHTHARAVACDTGPPAWVASLGRSSPLRI